MVLLDNDSFLTELTRLFLKSKAKGSGSINITMKKYDGRIRPEPNPNAPPLSKKVAKLKAAALASNRNKKTQKEPAQPGCLIRAKLHHRKIATVVHAKNSDRFQMSYCGVLRANMDALKKVKKSKNKANKQRT